MMIRIINNTDQNFRRLLYLYEPEINKVKNNEIECIVFEPCKITIWGIDKLLLEHEDK